MCDVYINYKYIYEYVVYIFSEKKLKTQFMDVLIFK